MRWPVSYNSRLILCMVLIYRKLNSSEVLNSWKKIKNQYEMQRKHPCSTITQNYIHTSIRRAINTHKPQCNSEVLTQTRGNLETWWRSVDNPRMESYQNKPFVLNREKWSMCDLFVDTFPTPIKIIKIMEVTWCTKQETVNKESVCAKRSLLVQISVFLAEVVRHLVTDSLL